MLDVLPAGVQGLNMLGHIQWLASLHLDRIFFRKLSAANARYEEFSKRQAEKRIVRNDTLIAKDIFYFLRKGVDPTTGTDTTATGIASTIFYLLHSDIAHQTLTTEILTAFTDVEQIRGDTKLSACRYLRACIDEALRMTPGVGDILPREVQPGGLIVDGRTYPAGVDVGVPIYALHHDERYFPRAFDYLQERWILAEVRKSEDDTTTAPLPEHELDPKAEMMRDDDDDNSALLSHGADSPSSLHGAAISTEGFRSAATIALARSAFCPFSVGPRGCVGKGMAYKEMTIVIARLVFLF
ncbi:hypothetical protein MMC25_005084 [Agyrium rufum]|nr:hypothetical protein [Agyrium rufum]